MLRSSLTIIALSVITIPAFACPKNCSCDSKGNVISYNTTNNSTNYNNPSSATSIATGGNSSSTATGGEGGKGGSATATVAAGAVSNNATVSGGTGGSANQTQSQNTENSGNNTGTSSSTNQTDISYDSPKIPVSTAYSAALVSGIYDCLGSASGGVQTVPVGITFGSTRIDQYCVLIRQTQLLRALGYPIAACYRMTMGKEGAEIKKAMEMAGQKCDPTVVSPKTPVIQPPIITQKDLDQLREQFDEKLDRIVTTLSSK